MKLTIEVKSKNITMEITLWKLTCKATNITIQQTMCEKSERDVSKTNLNVRGTIHGVEMVQCCYKNAC